MGLQKGDLSDLIYNIFEIDGYQSKMGSDKEIVVVSASVKDKAVGDDLVNFIEKGYNFVLDADVTSGEQSDGTYKVFVEMERNKEVPANILELVDGITKLGSLENPRFRYYKSFKSFPFDEVSLSENIPLDPKLYDEVVNESNLSNYKNFFNRSYVDDINVYEDIMTISKKYADPVNFKILDFGKKEDILESIEETLDVNGFAEVIFLSKYVGDYNITKYGHKLTLENKGHTLVLERL